MSNTVDTARGMAAAPRGATAPAPESTPAAPQAEKQFFDATDDDSARPPGVARGKVTDMFTAVIFRATDSDTVYTRKDGSKSRKIALVMVELNNSGVYIKGSIYARQGTRDPKARAEFGFFGANNQICLAYDDPSAKAELDRWRAQTAAEYVKWIRLQPRTPGGAIDLGADLEGTGITV